MAGSLWRCWNRGPGGLRGLHDTSLYVISLFSRVGWWEVPEVLEVPVASVSFQRADPLILHSWLVHGQSGRECGVLIVGVLLAVLLAGAVVLLFRDSYSGRS